MSQEWHYVDASQAQKGPVTVAEFAADYAAGLVPNDTLVWSPSISDWTPLASLPDLLAQIKPAARTYMHTNESPYL